MRRAVNVTVTAAFIPIHSHFIIKYLILSFTKTTYIQKRLHRCKLWVFLHIVTKFHGNRTPSWFFTIFRDFGSKIWWPCCSLFKFPKIAYNIFISLQIKRENYNLQCNLSCRILKWKNVNVVTFIHWLEWPLDQDTAFH